MMRKNYRASLRVRLDEQDIVRRWTISLETFVQQILGSVRLAVDYGHLSDAFLGRRFGRREITEVVLQMTYNAMHLHAEFDWEQFDYGDFLSVCIPDYRRKFNRTDNDNGASTMSHTLDDIIDRYMGELEDLLVEREMTGRYYEPVITIMQRAQFMVEVYDWRAYQWTLQDRSRPRATEEENERDPFYVRG